MPILPFFPVIGGLPIVSDQKKVFLEFFSKGARSDIPNDASTDIDQEGLLDGIDGFGYGQFVAYGPGFCTTRPNLSCTRVKTVTACHYALLSGLHKNIDNLDVSMLDGVKISDNSSFDEYFKLFVKFAQECKLDASFSKDDIKDGISFVNIWDVSVNKALSSFLKCYNGCFTNGCMCLLVDLQQDVPNLHKPLDNIDGSKEMMWRSRLHYLLHSCKILSQDSNDRRLDICSVVVNCSARDGKLETDLTKECEHAAKQIGVDSYIDYDPVVFNSTADDSKKNVFEHFNKLMLKQNVRNIPLSWVFLRGALDVMGNDGSVIIDDMHFRELASSQLFKFEKHELDDFCKFFSSFGSIFYIKKIKYSPLPSLIVIKPIEFIKRLDKLFSSSAPRESDNELIRHGIVTEEVASHFFVQTALFMNVLLSANFAVKLKTSQVATNVETNSNECYYIPSVRNGEPVKHLSYHAVHLCIDIMSPIVNIEVAIVAKLLNNGLEAHLELKEEVNVTHIRIKPSEALLSIICQGDIIEFKIADTEDKSVIEKLCSHIISTCAAVVEELSVDKKHNISIIFKFFAKMMIILKSPTTFIIYVTHFLMSIYVMTVLKQAFWTIKSEHGTKH